MADESTEKGIVQGEVTSSVPAEKPEITETERFVAAIGYVSFLCLLPILLKRDSNFAQFHGKQALLFAIFWFVMRFFFALIPILVVVELLSIGVCALMAYQGSYFKLPILGDKAEKLRF